MVKGVELTRNTLSNFFRDNVCGGRLSIQFLSLRPQVYWNNYIGHPSMYLLALVPILFAKWQKWHCVFSEDKVISDEVSTYYFLIFAVLWKKLSAFLIIWYNFFVEIDIKNKWLKLHTWLAYAIFFLLVGEVNEKRSLLGWPPHTLSLILKQLVCEIWLQMLFYFNSIII